MNKIIFVVIIIIVVLAGGYFLIKGNYKASNSLPSTSTVQPGAGGNVVSIKNFAFNPGQLNIKEGTTVRWVNEDTVPHQIKSASFNSAILQSGESFEFKFDQKGTYDYSCAIHLSMLGKIVVE